MLIYRRYSLLGLIFLQPSLEVEYFSAFSLWDDGGWRQGWAKEGSINPISVSERLF